LETQPSEAEIARLLAAAHETPRSFVLLSANVFTAAHRAIALGLAASPQVFVRASRREPCFPGLLAEAAPGLFTLVDEINAQAGDTVWAYGSDATMVELRRSFAPGTILKAHGDGFGVVVVRQSDLAHAAQAEWGAFADAVALDAALFDQRGCLSPRLVLAEGDAAFAQRLSQEVFNALTRVQTTIPRGTLSNEEQADISWYRQCVCCVGNWKEHPAGAVALVNDAMDPVPPPGRILQVCALSDVQQALQQMAPLLTCVAHRKNSESSAGSFIANLHRCAPHARHCVVGHMQQPPFDGPADLRPT
jgi:hypothetical protein